MTTTHDPRATATEHEPTPQEQSAVLLGHVAGYIAHRTIEMGLAHGFVRGIATTPGVTSEELADSLGTDDLYTTVWCRAAFAASVLERRGSGYALAPHMETLLLDEASPAYAGGLFPLFRQPELFDRFAENLHSGERLWWDETSPEWISRVAATGRPFYARLIPTGLARVPGLVERLEAGCRVLETACGTGNGLRLLAEAFPRCEVIGIDGDAHSIARAGAMLREAGLTGRVRVDVSPLEDVRTNHQSTLVLNNISMHECRDIDRVTTATRAALEPGGWFVISDFPFPDDDPALRSVPGRVMSGIQFFEAQIDDQLLSRSFYDGLLTRHGFVDIGSFGINPVHAVTYGRTPGVPA